MNPSEAYTPGNRQLACPLRWGPAAMRQEPGTVAPSHRQPDGEVPKPRYSPRRATERMYQEKDGDYSKNWTLWQIFSEEQQKKSNQRR